MDFEYENRTGPVDNASPFMQVSQNIRRQAPLSPSKSGMKKRGSDDVESAERVAKPCTGMLDSPSKALINHRPTSPGKQFPPTPFSGTPAFSALYTTPHKNQNELEDSSAGETPTNDSDATPDNSMRGGSKLARFDNATQPNLGGAEGRYSPSKDTERPSVQKSYSWDRTVASFKKVKEKFSSPGRHGSRDEYRIEKAEKKRRGQVDRRFRRDRRHSMSDSADESEQPRSRTRSPRKISRQHPEPVTAEPHWIASFFSFLAHHQGLPHVLAWYAQLLFNICLLSFCMYLVWCFWGAVAGDVEKRSWEAQQVVMSEVSACARDYKSNSCDPARRPPALELACANWERCMNQDPTQVKRAQVGAQTFAEIFNAFVEAISYKAMAFTFILVFGCFAISNFAFGYFREKAVGAPSFYAPPSQQQQQQQYFPPPTPQRALSGNQDYYPGTPAWQPVLEPAHNGEYGQIEDMGSPTRSPVRRLDYR